MKMVSVSAQILMVLGFVTMLSGCDDDKKSATDDEASPNVGANYQESRPFDEARNLRMYDANSPAIAQAREAGVVGMPNLDQATADGLYTMDAMAADGNKCDGSPSIRLEIYKHDFEQKSYNKYKNGYARWNEEVLSVAGMIGMDPNLIHAIISTESAYREDAVGPSTRYGTAKGLMQLLDSTAAKKSLGVTNSNDLFIGAVNIKAGSTYLKEMIVYFKGNVTLGIAAYNAGPGNIQRCGNRISPYAGRQTHKYAQHVIGFVNHYKLSGGYKKR